MKNKITKIPIIFSGVLFFLLFLSYVFPVSAQIPEIGTLDVPPGVDQYNAGANADIGLVFFISRMIRLATLVAGIWVFVNTVLAGYVYLGSGGKSDAHTKVKDILTMSLIGLVLIVCAYTITGLLSLLIYGDPTYILNPTIVGPA